MVTSNKKNTIHDWVRKVTHKELCKKLKFDKSANWYIIEAEYVLVNES